MLKGLKLSFKKKDEEKVEPENNVEEREKAEQDPMSSNLAKRPPELEKAQIISEHSAHLEKKSENDGVPQRRKYDFSKFEENIQTTTQVSIQRLEAKKESLIEAAEQVWDSLKNMDLQAASAILDRIDNSVYWWLHGGDSIFSGSAHGFSGLNGHLPTSNFEDFGEFKCSKENRKNDMTEISQRKMKDLQDYDKEVGRLAANKKRADDCIEEEYENLHQAGIFEIIEAIPWTREPRSIKRGI